MNLNPRSGTPAATGNQGELSEKRATEPTWRALPAPRYGARSGDPSLLPNGGRGCYIFGFQRANRDTRPDST